MPNSLYLRMQFTAMEPLNLPTYFFRIKEDRGKKYIFDEIRRRFVLLTPEEWVRQHLLNFLVTQKNFPLSLIAIEKGFKNNRRKQRYDLLVFDRKGEPLMMIECKAPGIDINQHVFDQAGRLPRSRASFHCRLETGSSPGRPYSDARHLTGRGRDPACP